MMVSRRQGTVILLTILVFHGVSTQQKDCGVVLSQEVILIKVGGSSITEKAVQETLNPTALQWLSETLASATSSSFQQQECEIKKRSFVIVHGAGSFGHHTAKEYGLSGQSKPLPTEHHHHGRSSNQTKLLEGLTKTRLSVQTLNHKVVFSLIQHGIPAIGISPCFGIPGLQAHGGDDRLLDLATIVNDCVRAGLVPVIHGDACLNGSHEVGILSGDTIMEALGVSVSHLTKAIFLTDVDGVFTADPRLDPEAQLLRTIDIDAQTAKVLTTLEASGSSHDHDVTGGLEVCICFSRANFGF
jgi:isopentenyl phosphate kinase